LGSLGGCGYGRNVTINGNFYKIKNEPFPKFQLTRAN
jgi:hypothetical protein